MSTCCNFVLFGTIFLFFLNRNDTEPKLSFLFWPEHLRCVCARSWTKWNEHHTSPVFQWDVSLDVSTQLLNWINKFKHFDFYIHDKLKGEQRKTSKILILICKRDINITDVSFSCGFLLQRFATALTDSIIMVIQWTNIFILMGIVFICKARWFTKRFNEYKIIQFICYGLHSH